MPLVIGTRSIGHDLPGGVQKVHPAPISRLGGLVIFIAYVTVLAVGSSIDHSPLTVALPIALCALPVVLAGLSEDLTGRVGPRFRMAAAVLSAMLASMYSSGVVPRLDLPLPDRLLQHLWFALPLTSFMVAGACNSINLIDGVNGLATGTALLMFGGIAAAAGWSGDVPTLAESLAVMGALVGFMLWNYPHGRIFLGDAGAYFIGFMYAELAIRLVARNSDISAWYVIVLAAYPIVETLFSMYRRGIVRHTALMVPDALHLHSLVYYRVAMPIERRQQHFSRNRANARVAPRLWIHGGLCLALAIAGHASTIALIIGFLVYVAFYVRCYRTLVRFAGRRPHGNAAPDAVVPDREVRLG
jgi:UDP-N-acetylmuramyl pentapeptide phosphotransferase/UDP-N-acetylglucosamine-1-phosphate transferase